MDGIIGISAAHLSDGIWNNNNCLGLTLQQSINSIAPSENKTFYRIFYSNNQQKHTNNKNAQRGAPKVMHRIFGNSFSMYLGGLVQALHVVRWQME